MNIGLFEVSIPKTTAIDTINVETYTQVNTKGSKLKYEIVKRALDIALSTIGMVVLFPVFLIIGICIKIDSKGPVFFMHDRIGKDGKKIKIYKFRTMYKNAEDMKNNFTPKQIEEFNENYKLKNDPRVTRVGKILRRTSLDELPQILNIFKGELSLIGPRPVVEGEIEKYGPNKSKFLSVKPGLTGYWQANGRSSTTYEERMNMELYYIDNRSLWLDVKVFFKTFISVIKKEGAM
jgi:lipopolysaccharide/colanic/teichoic acid biosynthesis glycosyltransferase